MPAGGTTADGAAPEPDASAADAGPRASAGGKDASPLDAASGDAATGLNADDAAADAATVARCVDAAQRHDRADQALASFMLRFWRADQQYLVEEVPGNEPAHYWVYAQAVDAVLDAAERTRGTRFVGLVEALLLGQARRTWSSDWYDDENWLALVLIRAYDLTGKAEYLDRAESLLQHIMDAWDETCCGAQPGGIWWDADHTQKATASNGGPVITAVRLHARTGSDTYLSFAVRAYEYWRRTMVDPDSYQVFDHVAPSGAITRWSFTYNEGVMIGAALELYRATQEAAYLMDARGYAARMRSAQTVEGPAGAVLYDGTNEGCGGDCQQFKGIGFRYLDLLERADPDPEIRALLQSSARSLWTVGRDAQSGSFSTNWAQAPTGESVSIRQMSAAVSALSLDAAYCDEYSAQHRPIEAEEALLRGVALEDMYAGFTGWGYVAAWGAAGQGVDLRLVAPTAGAYRVSFRYAAEAGATRRIAVNGALVEPAFAFAGTGSWTGYDLAALELQLVAGANLVSIDFVSGSNGFLNLDHAVMTPVP